MAFHLDVDMPRELAPLAWLIGRWEGAGIVGYPTIESVQFGQEIVCSHDGRPFLEWQSRTWLLDDEGNKVRPLATELGFWRVAGEESGERSGTDDGRPVPANVELMLAHPFGIVEMYYGTATPAKVELRTDGVMRSPRAKDYAAGARLYGYVNSNLMYAFDMAAMGLPVQAHVSAELKRVS